MGALRGRRRHVGVRAVLRRRAGIDPVDDHGRAVQPGSQAGRHVHRRARQLARQLLSRPLLPPTQGD